MWGPAPQSVGRYQYYVSFIEDFSKFTWIYLLRNRSEVFQVFLRSTSADNFDTVIRSGYLLCIVRNGECSLAFEGHYTSIRIFYYMCSTNLLRDCHTCRCEKVLMAFSSTNGNANVKETVL